jgi:hypothetical protein
MLETRAECTRHYGVIITPVQPLPRRAERQRDVAVRWGWAPAHSSNAEGIRRNQFVPGEPGLLASISIVIFTSSLTTGPASTIAFHLRP